MKSGELWVTSLWSDKAQQPLGHQAWRGQAQGFMPEVRAWAKGQGNRHRAPESLCCPGLPGHLLGEG